MPKLLKDCCLEYDVTEFEEWSAGIIRLILERFDPIKRRLVIESLTGVKKFGNQTTNIANDAIYLYGYLALYRYYGDENLFSDHETFVECIISHLKCYGIDARDILNYE